MRTFTRILPLVCTLIFAAANFVFGLQVPGDPAARRANDFLVRIGVTTTASQNGPVLNTANLSESKYWRTRRSFKTADKSRVEVDPASSTITMFFNQGLATMVQNSNRPIGSPISKAMAISKAQAVFQAAGAAQELGKPVAVLFQLSNPPTFAGHNWMVTYDRQFRGVPYRNQRATATMLAETGEVIAMGLAFTTPPARTAVFRITEQTALANAKRILATHDIRGATLRRVFKEFVQPNRRWIDNSLEIVGRPSDSPVAVWHVDMAVGNTIHEVWVQASNGEVVGGETIGLAPKRSVFKDKRR